MEYKDMEKFIQYLFQQQKLKYSEYMVAEEGVKDKNMISTYINEVLNMMNHEERKLIENEFVYQIRYWWTEYYSRATYYRFKKKCMRKFIQLINTL